jgi:hypothetical protein
MSSRILHLISSIESMLSFNHCEHTFYKRFLDSLCSEYIHTTADTMRNDLEVLYDHALPIVAKRIRDQAPDVGISSTFDGWKGRDKNGYIGSHAHFIKEIKNEKGLSEWVVEMIGLVYSLYFDPRVS